MVLIIKIKGSTYPASDLLGNAKGGGGRSAGGGPQKRMIGLLCAKSLFGI